MERDSQLINKMANATKWSTLSEVIAKLIVPITNMVLARILAPEIFGIVATINMITSLGDMLTDAGFQKYLIQHQFKNKKELFESANVAFITNLIMSCLVWGIIAIFNEQIAKLLGNDGYGFALCIAALQLPVTALSSIQMAIYKKKLDFKTLFIRRIVSILLPFFITIPLALFGFRHWSLIIGTLLGNIMNAIILSIYSEWRPSKFFKYSILKEMFSFSSWSLIESLTIWVSANIDTFIIGSIMNSYYLGLYKSSVNMINSIMSLITMSITPVLLAGISNLQNDDIKYREMFFRAQRIIAWMVFPLGFGLFLYRELAVNILFGQKWIEAADIIGIAALIIPFKISISSLVSICYTSKGRPEISVLSQMLYIVPLIPVSVYTLNSGFWRFVYVRNIFVFELIFVNLILTNFVMKISAIKMIKNIFKPMLACFIMGIVHLFIINIFSTFIGKIISILICAITYIIIMILLGKSEIINIIKLIYRKKQKSSLKI